MASVSTVYVLHLQLQSLSCVCPPTSWKYPAALGKPTKEGNGLRGKNKESFRKHAAYSSSRRLRREKRTWENTCSRLRTWNPASVRAGSWYFCRKYSRSGSRCYFEGSQAYVPVQDGEGVWEKSPKHVGISLYYGAFCFLKLIFSECLVTMYQALCKTHPT